MPRHHGQTIRKNHLQHKKLVIKVINTNPIKKCKRLKIKSITLNTCLHQVFSVILFIFNLLHFLIGFVLMTLITSYLC